MLDGSQAVGWEGEAALGSVPPSQPRGQAAAGERVPSACPGRQGRWVQLSCEPMKQADAVAESAMRAMPWHLRQAGRALVLWCLAVAAAPSSGNGKALCGRDGDLRGKVWRDALTLRFLSLCSCQPGLGETVASQTMWMCDLWSLCFCRWEDTAKTTAPVPHLLPLLCPLLPLEHPQTLPHTVLVHPRGI